MRRASKQFLKEMLLHPSPSGYEGPVREIWKKEVSIYADEVSVV